MMGFFKNRIEIAYRLVAMVDHDKIDHNVVPDIFIPVVSN